MAIMIKASTEELDVALTAYDNWDPPLLTPKQEGGAGSKGSGPEEGPHEPA